MNFWLLMMKLCDFTWSVSLVLCNLVICTCSRLQCSRSVVFTVDGFVQVCGDWSNEQGAWPTLVRLSPLVDRYPGYQPTQRTGRMRKHRNKILRTGFWFMLRFTQTVSIFEIVIRTRVKPVRNQKTVFVCFYVNLLNAILLAFQFVVSLASLLTQLLASMLVSPVLLLPELILCDKRGNS